MSKLPLMASRRVPSIKDFIGLRALMEWGAVTEQQAAKSLQMSLVCATVYDSDNLLAMGRIVGDGALFFYVQDVVVHPDFQRRGLGSLVMQELERFLACEALPGATVGLLAARGKEAFYRSFGYDARDGKALGMGMCKFVTCE